MHNKTVSILALVVLALGIIALPTVHLYADNKQIECDGCKLSFKGKNSIEITFPKSGSGEVGPKGDPGEMGPAGQDGVNGQDGRDGVNGTNGVDGKDGVNGTNGVDGKDGMNGTDGKDANLTQSQTDALAFVESVDKDALKAVIDLYNNGSLGLIDVSPLENVTN